MTKPIKDLPEKTVPNKNDYIIYTTEEGTNIFVTKKITVADILNNTMDVIPAARVQKSTDTTLTTGVSASIALDTEDFDTDSMWSSGNSERFTFNTIGKYLIIAEVEIEFHATGQRDLSIYHSVGNTIISKRSIETIENDSEPTQLIANVVLDVDNTGEYVWMEVLQSSGGDLDVLSSGEYSPVLSAIRIG